MNRDDLGDRMKKYEDLARYKLLPRVPKVIRIDGKSFHTVMAKVKKPYDERVNEAMNYAAVSLVSEIGGTARLTYTQSDECSIVLNDGLDLNTQAWFDNNIQKISSVAASIFTYKFNESIKDYISKPAYFDARVFNLPDINELTNYLVWRQADARRNSIQQYGRSFFSQKELYKLSCLDIIDKMLKDKDFDWLTAPFWTRHGTTTVGKTKLDKGLIFESAREAVAYYYRVNEDTIIDTSIVDVLPNTPNERTE